MLRSLAPTTSIGCFRSRSRISLKIGRPASFSAIHRLANSPALDLGEQLLHRLPSSRSVTMRGPAV